MDLAEVDVSRMGAWASQRRWLHERTVESLGSLYDMHWPGKQPKTARGLRRLPLHDAHRAAGAAFGQVGGWERPLWFEPGVIEPEIRYDYRAPSWFPAVREEVEATRNGVALYDLTTYSKFLVQGPGAVAGLQRLATSDMDVEVGRIVYTVLANERGGIEMDPTITRLGASTFLVLAPTLSQRRTMGLLRGGLPDDAVVTDVTSGFATLHVAGPRSRELLARLTDEELSTEAWPFLRACQIEVGRVTGWAFRVSYTGELGWELMVSTELVADLYEHLVAAGRTSGCARRGRSRSRPRGWSAASAPGATTSVRSTTRSRPGWASPCRDGRRRTTWAARRSMACGRRRNRSVAWSRSTPRTPCCGTASRCSATASESGSSPARRSRRRSAAQSGWPGSTARSRATGRSRSARGRPLVASASTRSTTRAARGSAARRRSVDGRPG